MRTTLLVLAMAWSGFSGASAHADPSIYKVVVLADAGSATRAQEYIAALHCLSPFSALLRAGELELPDSPTIYTSDEVVCTGGLDGIARLAQCKISSDRINALIASATLAPIFTSVPNIGAGGSQTPIVSSSFPWTTALHETTHTFGFTDDYAYTAAETADYCTGGALTAINGYSNQSMPATFTTEAAAIASCQTNIPWCTAAIAMGTPVTTANADGTFAIGTPPPATCPDDRLGVYAGGACQVAVPAATWRPSYCPTIMGFPTLGEDYCPVEKRQALLFFIKKYLPAFYQQQIADGAAQQLNLPVVQLTQSELDTGWGCARPSDDDSLKAATAALADGLGNCKLPPNSAF